MPPRLWCAACLAASFAAPTSALEYNGRVMLGAYQAQEKLEEPSAGQTSNDRREILGRVFLDVTGIGPMRNQFTVDFRDKYDEFGKVDADRLVLVEANEPQLRQLALKYPFERDRIYWALGRFPVADAGVFGVDGAELAYRFSGTTRAGVFGGLIPQRERGKSLEISPDDRQAGLYAVWQRRSRDWSDHAYVANALVAEQRMLPPAVVERADPDGPVIPEPPPPDPSLPEGVDPEAPVPVDSLHWFHNAVFQPSQGLRLTSLANVYLTPNAAIRNGALGATRTFTKQLTGSLSVLRVDLAEYRRTRDVRERLAPSDYNQAKTEVRWKPTTRLMLLTTGLYGSRGVDGRTKAEGTAGVVLSQIASQSLALSALVGQRKNFESRDTFVRAGVDLWLDRFELRFDQQVGVERRDDGETLHPQISTVMLGFMVTDAVLASAGAEYAKDERATLTTALLTVGYRFGSRQLTPLRDRAPAPESVGLERL